MSACISMEDDMPANDREETQYGKLWSILTRKY